MFVWNKFIYTNKIKTKHTTLSEQLQKCNRKIVETEAKLIHQTHIYDRLLSWLGIGTSKQSGGGKLMGLSLFS